MIITIFFENARDQPTPVGSSSGNSEMGTVRGEGRSNVTHVGTNKGRDALRGHKKSSPGMISSNQHYSHWYGVDSGAFVAFGFGVVDDADQVGDPR